jgi:hypothetical protein
MKRQRKNSDYDYRAHKYHCKPVGELPQAYYEERRGMIALWNDLCDLDLSFEEARCEFARNYDSGIVHEEEILQALVLEGANKKDIYTAEKSLKARRRKACRAGKYREPEPGFLKSASGLTKEYVHIHWGNREAVLNGFINARQKILARQGGRPKKKHKNSSMSFQLRYTGGGRDVHKLKKTSKVFYIENSKFFWTIGGEVTEWTLNMHRPLPEYAAVKTIRLTESYEGYHISFACEIEPEEKLPHGDAITIFEPRWTVDEKTMIVGRVQQALKSKELKWENFDTHNPPALKNIYQRAKQSDMLHSKAKKDQNNGGAGKAYWSQKRDVERRFIRHRDWCYWNFAKKIASESQVILLRKLDIKKLGMKRGDNKFVAPAVRRCMRLAAPADLYSKIEKQAYKYGVDVRYYKDNEEFSQIYAEYSQK